MRRACGACLAGLLFVLSGCVVGPNFKRPAIDAPPTFRGQPAPESASIADLPKIEGKLLPPQNSN